MGTGLGDRRGKTSISHCGGWHVPREQAKTSPQSSSTSRFQLVENPKNYSILESPHCPWQYWVTHNHVLSIYPQCFKPPTGHLDNHDVQIS